MTATSRWADGLFEMLTLHDRKPKPSFQMQSRWGDYCVLHQHAPGDHSDCTVNTCRVCVNPVTNQQVNDGDAHPDGDDAETYVHRECAQGEKCGD